MTEHTEAASMVGHNTPPDDYYSGLISSPQIQKTMEMWRQREDMVRATTKLTLSGKSALRRACQNDKELASKIFDKTVKELKKGVIPSECTYADYVTMVLPIMSAMKPLNDQKAMWEKALAVEGTKFPISHMTDQIAGIGSIAIAKVVAELGDLSRYKSTAGMMKRAGMAVIDGERQRKCANKEKAIKHGYNPSRRAVFWNIGNALLLAQRGAAKKGNPAPYLEFYTEKKAKELARPGMTKAQAENRAKRYMTQKLLKDMRREWLRANAREAA